MSFAYAVLAALAIQAQAQTGDLRGTVVGLSEGDPRPLPHAMVEVHGATGSRAVLADALGRYTFSGLAPGLHRVRAVHVGHEQARLEVLVPAGGSVTVDFALTAKPVELPGIVVRADPPALLPLPDAAAAPQGGRARAELSLRVLEATPGLAEAGLAEAARRLPGNEPADPTDVLFMRGSTTDLKLVLLDGAPVYTPFHLGGLLRSFEPELLGSATHHVGGAPARYDGGLSYILDVRTRSPARDRARWSGALDLMSASSTAETPVGERAGLLVSTRALHGLASRLAGGASPYGYLDGLFKGELDLGPGRLFLTAFGNDESVRLNLSAPRIVPAGDPLSDRSLRPGDAAWGNTALALAYSAGWGRTGLDASVSTTRYRADLPLPARADTSSAPPAGTPPALLTRGETDRARLTVDLVRWGEHDVLRAGASLDHLRLRFGARHLGGEPAGLGAFDAAAHGTVAGAYLDALRRLAGEVHLRSGARVDVFAPGGARGALRVALLWNLTGEALLTLAGGRYHQFSRTAESDLELAVGGPAAGLRAVSSSGAGLSVASADHVVLTLDQQLTPDLRLTTEGFFKRFSGLEGFTGSSLNASGLDLRVLREGAGVTGWLGYSLSWFWEGADALGRTDEFTGRHMLSAGLQARPGERWGFDLTLGYSDGLPLTSIPSGRRAAAPETTLGGFTGAADSSITARSSDSFLRLDAEVFADLTPTAGGRTVLLRPYLRVLNALDRRDALFYYFDPWRDPELRPLAELSVIPILGVEWRF